MILMGSGIGSCWCRLPIHGRLRPDPDSSPHAARRFVEDEIVRWTPVIKAIGLKPQ
jgi:hypothetical protein